MKLLKLSLLACALITFNGPAHARSEPAPLPDTFSCESDADCVAARAPCGEIRAVSREYHGQAQAEWDRLATLVECAGLAVVPEDIPSCSAEKICVMIPPPESRAQPMPTPIE